MESFRMNTTNKQSLNIIQHPVKHMMPPMQQQFSKQAIDLKKDSEKLQNDQERLSNLHSKLHKEAEKIRNWKNEKDMELKQKDRSLSDALQTIDSLRKSIYELQVQNESFSTKLHQTELEKVETEQNIKTVREMANILREQLISLENRIIKGEQDKETINQVTQSFLEENQILLLKFQDLDISKNAMVEKYSKQVQNMEANYTEKILNTHQKSLAETSASFFEVSQKLNNCNEKLLEAENLYKLAQSENDAKDIHAKEVENIYTNEIVSLQNDIKNLSLTLNQTKIEFEKVNEQIKSKEEEIKDLSKKLKSMTILLNETEEKLDKANQLISEMELSKKNNLQAIVNCENELFNVKENFKSVIDDNATLNLKILELNEFLLKHEVEKKEYQSQIQNMEVDLERLNEYDRDRKRMQVEYENQIEYTKLHIGSLDTTIAELKLKNNEFENETIKLSKENCILLSKVEQLQYSIEEKVFTLSEQQKQHNALITEIFELKKTNKEQETILNELKDKEIENELNLKNELADREKKSEDLGIKTKSLQSQINNKAKQLKSIEKECKSLKIQLKSKIEKIEKHEEQLKVSADEITSSNAKLLDCTKKLETAEKELGLMISRCDNEQREFCLTLEHYKIENDKIVESYEKDNSAMKQQIEELQKSFSDKVDSLRNQLKEAIQLNEYQKIKILQLEENLSKMSSLEFRNQELEKLIKELSHQVDLERSNSHQIQAEYEQKLKSQAVDSHVKDHKFRVEEIVDVNQLYKFSPAKENFSTKDRLVPTTPHIRMGTSAPITPQSILRSSQSKRGKRVLFTGMHDKENSILMDTNEFDERPPKTPAFNEVLMENKSNSTKHNTRYSPNPCLVQQLRCENRTDANVLKKNSDYKKLGETKSPNVDTLIEAHFNVVNKTKQLFNSQARLQSDINKSSFKNKAKRVAAKMKNSSAEQNLSWFDADSVFGFDS
nr:synaptonemal complex protein 1 isoform X2 [Hydra vulgaris]